MGGVSARWLVHSAPRVLPYPSTHAQNETVPLHRRAPACDATRSFDLPAALSASWSTTLAPTDAPVKTLPLALASPDSHATSRNCIGAKSFSRARAKLAHGIKNAETCGALTCREGLAAKAVPLYGPKAPPPSHRPPSRNIHHTELLSRRATHHKRDPAAPDSHRGEVAL